MHTFPGLQNFIKVQAFCRLILVCLEYEMQKSYLKSVETKMLSCGFFEAFCFNEKFILTLKGRLFVIFFNLKIIKHDCKR